MPDAQSGPQRFVPPRRQQNVATLDAVTAAIRQLAERQHGVVAWRQLRELGLTAGAVRNRIRRGHLITIHRGVFALGHRRLDQHGLYMAAVLACGPSAVLSHGSATHLWRIQRSRRPIEVSRVSGHLRPHGVRLHQPRALPSGDVTEIGGIPVTSLERTLADICGRFDERQLERLLVEADRSGQLSWPILHTVLDRPGGRRGIGRLRRVAREVDPRAAETRSAMEVDFLALCRKAKLPPPQVNVLVEGRLVDFFWPEARLVVETDGYAFHNDRLAFERDRRSSMALAAADYVVHRFTYRMLAREPEAVIDLLRRCL